MAIAIRLPTLRRLILGRAPRYERRPRVMVNRSARAALSRETRWRKRGTGWTGRALGVIAALGVAVAVWFAWPAAAPPPAPLAFPDFVAEAEAAFPESLRGHTRARSGELADGRTVPVGLTMLLSTGALESVSASPDALTRLAAPYVGAERAISGEEMGARVARLAGMALPEGISSCYTYETGAPRRMALSETRNVRITPLDIAFNPEC